MLKLFAFFARVFFALFEGIFYAIGYMAGAVTQSNQAKPKQAARQAQVSEKPVSSERVAVPSSKVGAMAFEGASSVPAAQARPVQKESFHVADRVQTAELFGRGGIQLGVMWLYLYPEKRIAKRVFKVTHRPLALALKWDRRYMPDVPFDNMIGHQPIMDAMAREVSALLNKTQEPKREKVREKPQSKAPVGASTQVHSIAREATAETIKPESTSIGASHAAATPVIQKPVQKLVSDDTSVVMPNSHRAVKGETYIGKVTTAGMTQKDGADGPYQTFCLTIHDGEREIPLSGNELKRQVRDLDVKVGENVRVVFMGKVAVDVPGKKKPGFKNLYQVTRVEERA